MHLKTLYVRFYKSFNYDYLRKSDLNASPHPWDILPDERFFPFVRVSLERDITTVVGSNEAGKSQLLSAIKCLLTGSGIRRRDFCRYSDLFAVNKAMAVPEFGGRFSGLSDDQRAAISQLLDLEEASDVDDFYLFRFNGRNVIYVRIDGEWADTEVDDDEVSTLGLPTYFEIDADVPLPNSVPIDYLVRTDEEKGARSRPSTIQWFSGLLNNPGWIRDLATYGAQVASGYPDDDEADGDLLAQLGLAERLLIDVAGIDRSAFEELQSAVKTSEGYANGLVDHMNKALADSLNFTKWWTQDSEFGLYLTLRDFDLVLTVRDRTGSDYSFSERSSGLSYFLSYFVQYLSHHHAEGGQEILLMDEPDTYLSMVGQQDLLRVFEAFANPDNGDPAVQVVYVTHSPFLIDKNHSERIRVLQKGDGEEGTRLVANAGRNHYEPLRSAFGAFVAETTFISNCNLMLEGQADQVLLAGISSLARRAGFDGDTLDLNHLSLVPCGSAEHIPYMAYLARGRDVDTPAVIVLLDGDSEADKIAAELKKGYRDKRLVADDFIIQTRDLDLSRLKVDTTDIRELEDLIPAAVATEAIKEFAREVLSPEGADHVTRVLSAVTVNSNAKLFKSTVKAAEAASPDPDAPLRLDKVGFARAVLHVLNQNEALRDQTIANFGVLFERINAAQRDANRKNSRERTTKTLNRLRGAFLKDHPTSATRREVQSFLEDVEDQLVDAASETELIRAAIRIVRKDYDLNVSPASPVGDYEALTERLRALTYEAVRDVQNATPTL